MKTFINIWETNKDTGEFSVRWQNRVIETMTIPWYFAIKLEDAKKIRQELIEMKELRYVDKFVKENEWLRIYCPYGRRERVLEYVKELKIDSYEGDLKMWQRYLTDEDIELETNQKILYFDIETDDRGVGIDPGRDQILSIAAIGSDREEYQFFSMTNEKKMLQKFVDLIDQYDILTGWNSESFDLVAITRRCKMFNIKIGCYNSDWSKAGKGGLTGVRVSGKMRARPYSFNHIDMMMKVKELHYRDTELIKKVRSFSLQAVSQAILGEGKLDVGVKNIYILAQEDPKRLQEYNMQDVRLLVKLDAKLNIIKQKIIEHEVCSSRLNDYTSHGKIDPYALRAARKMGKYLLSRPDKEINDQIEFKEIDPALQEESQRGTKAKGDYVGGYVFEPVKGLHSNLYVFDFQSLYPSIIKTFNVSLDTYLGTAASAPTARGLTLPIDTLDKRAIFSSQQKGIIPTIIQNVLDQRNNIRFKIMKSLKKDSEEYWNWHYRQYAFKVLANSMYGIMGANFSRFFKRELAEGITLTGQYLIKLMWKWMVKHGFTPIYGDSDSLFVIINREVNLDKMNKAMKVYLDNDLKQYGIKDSSLQMDFEKKFERFIMVAKKKYIGIAADGSMKISGLEMKKRDTLPKAEQWQKTLLDNLLKKDLPVERYLKVVKNWKTLVYSGKLKREDLTFQKRLSQDLESYGKKKVRDKKLGGFKLDKEGKERFVPIPVHVRVAQLLKSSSEKSRKKSLDKTDSYSAGSYIPYIITGSKEKLEAIHADEFKGKYDADYYWTACFGASQRVLEVVFPTVDWENLTLKKQKQQTLL